MIDIPGYRLLRQLGRGGMATVYLALQQSVDREVALKIMSPALLVDPNFGERFQREAKIAARLHHRHVVGIHDIGRVGDQHYIAMEYLGGGPVLPKDGQPRAPAFALRVISEIADALNYAHEKGFVHRDVKPDNILLRDDGSAVLTDFGIARALDAAQCMTRTGAVVGTPHYMSPEQARGRQIDGRSDLYALGVVLHELLVGCVPYSADDSLAVGIMHITEPVPVLPPRLAMLQPLLERLLAKQPEDRFQTGSAVVAAVAALDLHEFDLQPMDPSADEPVDVPPMRARDTPPAEMSAVVGPMQAANIPRERAEPNLGHIDDLSGLLDENVMRAERTAVPAPRAPRRQSPSRRGPKILVAMALLAVALLVAWQYQDRLRQLLPRTEFNDTLSRAQRALDAGNLSNEQGDGARELFLAARAQDPDNDIARRGLETVGQRLLERARSDVERNDLAAARKSLDGARELLGGGTDVESLEQTLKQRESADNETERQLDDARAALGSGRLLGKNGAAALYQKVLDIDNANAVAHAGVKKVADALAQQAGAALVANDADAASARADEIARILPGYPGLPVLLGRIAKVRDAARSALEGKLDHAEVALREGRFSGGTDSALVLFREVLRRDPANARAKAGLAQVAQALVVQANAAIDDSNPDAAGKLLASAAELAPNSQDLRAARVELRELRERLAIGAERVATTPAQAAEVRKLVISARAAVAAGRLIIPPGDSAYDKYRAALAIDGNDPDALAGLAQLPARAKDLFLQALSDGAPQRARAQLAALRQVAPDDASIPVMSEKLANAFLDQADARIGEGRRTDAANALAAARELSPHNPRLAPLSARLRAMGDRSSMDYGN